MGIGSKGGSNPSVITGVGGLTDFVTVPYSFGINSMLAHLNTAYYHIHGQPFVYPELSNDITVTAGAGVWGTGGAITEIIPAGALSVSAFDLHWVNINNHSADAYYLLEIYAGDLGSEVKIGSTRSWRDSTFLGGETATGTKRIQIPQQPLGNRISAKLYSSDGSAATVGVSFEGHYYAT